DLRDALRDGYLARGVDVFTARVTAGVAVELLQIALERWLADETGAALTEHLAAVRAGMSDALADA
ncbi:hypothetical protein ACSTI1_00415, partial [Vibrio parahaemolyticus]